jgi:hypothetical protein
VTCPSRFAFLFVPVCPHSLGLPSQSNLISFMLLYPFIPLPSLRIYSTGHTITTVTLSYQIIEFTELRSGITTNKCEQSNDGFRKSFKIVLLRLRFQCLQGRLLFCLAADKVCDRNEVTEKNRLRKKWNSWFRNTPLKILYNNGVKEKGIKQDGRKNVTYRNKKETRRIK